MGVGVGVGVGVGEGVGVGVGVGLGIGGGLGPGDGEVGKPAGELVSELAIAVSQDSFGKDVQRRAVLSDELGDWDALEAAHDAQPRGGSKLGDTADGVTDDDGTLVTRLHEDTLWGRIIPDAVSCSKVDRSVIWSMEIRTKTMPGLYAGMGEGTD